MDLKLVTIFFVSLFGFAEASPQYSKKNVRAIEASGSDENNVRFNEVVQYNTLPRRHIKQHSSVTSPSLVSYGANLTPLISPSPRILTEGKLIQIALGDTLTLHCDIENVGGVAITPVWTKGIRVISASQQMIRKDRRMSLVRGKGDGKSMKSGLNIVGVKRSDAGEYTCQMERDEHEPLTVRHTVEILVPPTISTKPQSGEMLVKKGTQIKLTCNTSGNPKPTLSWSKVRGQISNEKSQLGDSGHSLILHDVSRSDAGAYECRASNGVGNDVKEQIRLQVMYEPEVSAEYKVLHGGVNYQVELVCIVYADPEAEVSWYKDTMLLHSNDRTYVQKKGNRYTLLIRQVEMRDFGNYSCLARNSMGKGRDTILIQGNPKTPVFNSRVDSQSGTSYKLSWVTESYTPIDDYRLLYRPLPDDPSEELFYAYNNIIIDGVGSQGYEHHQSYILENLSPDTMYEAQIQARNSFGWSQVTDKFQFYTRAYDSEPINRPVQNPAHHSPWGLSSAHKSQCAPSITFTLIFAILISSKMLLCQLSRQSSGF